jgi:hypothetical protein
MRQPGCESERLDVLGFDASLRQRVGTEIASAAFQLVQMMVPLSVILGSQRMFDVAQRAPALFFKAGDQAFHEGRAAQLRQLVQYALIKLPVPLFR